MSSSSIHYTFCVIKIIEFLHLNFKITPFIYSESLLGTGSWNRGQVCRHEDDVIRSGFECKTSIEKLGYLIKGHWWLYYRNNGSMPSGCSIVIQNRMDNRPGIRKIVTPYFEESPSGLGTGRKDLIPICKRTVKFGSYSFYLYLPYLFY